MPHNYELTSEQHNTLVLEAQKVDTIINDIDIYNIQYHYYAGMLLGLVELQCYVQQYFDRQNKSPRTNAYYYGVEDSDLEVRVHAQGYQDAINFLNEDHINFGCPKV